MRIKNTESEAPKVSTPEPKPTAPAVDESTKALARALLSQSENSLLAVETLIKSQHFLESHAIVLDKLVKSAKTPTEVEPKKAIRLRVTEFDNFGRPVEYLITRE